MENQLIKTGGISERPVEIPDPPPPPNAYNPFINIFGGVPNMGGSPITTQIPVPAPTGGLPEANNDLRLVEIPPNPLTGEPGGAILMPKVIADLHGL
ncbi:MAG TPA: hypothetical protein PLP22_01995 [Candidatus Competibacter sp.]|nr:hypothetical protein [Candidatus Competibacteraceae bacterium]HRE53548.1 hypothetical protein [Candidatus Competibacter sp.]HUM93269.1 hypothetical protein [Candidatus Competibacter sp.]